MANDIKVAFAMDNASWRAVDNAIKALIVSTDRLAKSMEGVARNVSKINTPGGRGGGPTQNIRVEDQKRGILGRIFGDSGAVGRMVTETNRAFDDIGRKLTAFTSQAQKDIASLNSSISGIGKSAGGGGGYSYTTGPGFGSSGGVPAGSAGAAPSGAPAHAVPSPGGRGPGGGSGWGRFGSSGALSGGAQGIIYGAAGGVEALASGNMGGFLGSTLGRFGIAGAVAYGGYRLGNAVSEMGHDSYFANQQFQLYQSVRRAQLQSEGFSPFKRYANAVVSNNVGAQWAMEEALTRPEFKDSVFNGKLALEEVTMKTGSDTWRGMGKAGISNIGKAIAQAQIGRAMSATDESSTRYILSGRSGAGKLEMPSEGAMLWNSFKETAGDSALGLFGFVPGVGRSASVTRTAFEVQKQKETEEAQVIGARNLMSTADALAQQRSRGFDYFDQQMSGSNALGIVGAMRMMGRSTADIKLKDGTTVTAYEHVRAQALAGGWDVSDLGAGHQRNLSLGAGYGKIFGYTGQISAGMAGFGNLGQIVKGFGTITGSLDQANAYKNLINGRGGITGGAGGLDVGATREFAQEIVQSVLAGGMGGGSTLMATTSMMAKMVYGGGADVAGQQRAMYAYGLGNQLEKTYTSGSRSPFDKAASWQDAIFATGGQFDAGTIRLQELGASDPRALAAIAYGGAKAPVGMEELITPDTARKYLESSKRRTFATVVDEQWANYPKHAEVLKQIRSHGGDTSAVLADRLAGRDLGKVGGKKWMAAEREETQFMASFLGGNKVANAAMLSEQFLRTQVLDGPKGDGVGVAAPKGMSKAAIERERVVMDALSKYGSLENMPQAEKDQLYKTVSKEQAAAIIKANGADLGDIGSLSDNFVKAASDLASAIKGRAGTSKPQKADPLKPGSKPTVVQGGTGMRQ